MTRTLMLLLAALLLLELCGCTDTTPLDVDAKWSVTLTTGQPPLIGMVVIEHYSGPGPENETLSVYTSDGRITVPRTMVKRIERLSAPGGAR